MIQSASFHADEDLILARLRVGNVFVGENFGSAELMNANGFHVVFLDDSFGENQGAESCLRPGLYLNIGGALGFLSKKCLRLTLPYLDTSHIFKI